MYEIRWGKKAFEELESLDFFLRKRIIKKLDELALKFFSGDVKRLVGSDYYRLRVGDYRVIFGVDNFLKILKVAKVGHWKGIYKS